VYNGEINAERLNNWIRKIEVCFCVQQINEEEVNIQLASLRLEGTTLIWWEKVNFKKVCKRMVILIHLVLNSHLH
jgi:hypothetical protein